MLWLGMECFSQQRKLSIPHSVEKNGILVVDFLTVSFFEFVLWAMLTLGKCPQLNPPFTRKCSHYFEFRYRFKSKKMEDVENLNSDAHQKSV